MEKFKTELHRVSSRNPKDIIEWIDAEFPELKGLCTYDKEQKILVSKDTTKCGFYFDPFHSVLEITSLKQ